MGDSGLSGHTPNKCGAPFIDEVGKRYGKWEVLEKAGVDKRGSVMFRVRCDCGEEKRVAGYALRRGSSQGCHACANRKRESWRAPVEKARELQTWKAMFTPQAIAKRTPHGFSVTHPKEYAAIGNLNRRCFVPKSSHYSSYGGRGIGVCTELHLQRYGGQATHQDAVSFLLTTVGAAPTAKHTLGRIDNNGHYEPNNLRWETRTEQIANKRPIKLTTDDVHIIRELLSQGKTQKSIAQQFGVAQSTVWHIHANKTWRKL